MAQSVNSLLGSSHDPGSWSGAPHHQVPCSAGSLLLLLPPHHSCMLSLSFFLSLYQINKNLESKKNLTDARNLFALQKDSSTFLSHQWYIKHMPFTTVLRRKIGINVCETPSRVGPYSCQLENNSGQVLFSLCANRFCQGQKMRTTDSFPELLHIKWHFYSCKNSKVG